MRKTVHFDFLSDDRFFGDDNTLFMFLDYAYSDNMDISLTEKDSSFLLEVRTDLYDGSLRQDRVLVPSENSVTSRMIGNPFIKLGSELCNVGHFLEIQSAVGEDDYSLTLQVQSEQSIQFEYCDSGLMNDSETLYIIAFDEDVSEVWSTIKEFASDNPKVDYFIDSVDGDRTQVL